MAAKYEKMIKPQNFSAVDQKGFTILLRVILLKFFTWFSCETVKTILYVYMAFVDCSGIHKDSDPSDRISHHGGFHKNEIWSTGITNSQMSS